MFSLNTLPESASPAIVTMLMKMMTMMRLVGCVEADAWSAIVLVSRDAEKSGGRRGRGVVADGEKGVEVERCCGERRFGDVSAVTARSYFT